MPRKNELKRLAEGFCIDCWHEPVRKIGSRYCPWCYAKNNNRLWRFDACNREETRRKWRIRARRHRRRLAMASRCLRCGIELLPERDGPYKTCDDCRVTFRNR